MIRHRYLALFGGTLLVAAQLSAAQAYTCVTTTCRGYCKLPVQFSLGNPSEDLGPDVSESEVKTAFTTWTKPSCSGLTIQYTGRSDAQPGNGNGAVGWVETGWTNGNAVIGTTTSRISGNCLQSSMILNGQDFTWVTSSPMANKHQVNTFSIVGHESGHFFGLGHSPNRDAIMYASYSSGIKELTQDDIDGICKIYPGGNGGVAPSVDGGAPVMTVRRDGGTARDSGAMDNPLPQRDGGTVPPPGRPQDAAPISTPPVPAQRDAGSTPTPPPVTAGSQPDGDRCQVNGDCLSEVCLEQNGQPVCTRPCDTDADCRRTFVCRTVGKSKFCQAGPTTGSDAGASGTPNTTDKTNLRGKTGCAYAPASRQPRTGVGWALAVAVGFLALRRRPRRQ